MQQGKLIGNRRSVLDVVDSDFLQFLGDSSAIGSSIDQLQGILVNAQIFDSFAHQASFLSTRRASQFSIVFREILKVNNQLIYSINDHTFQCECQH